ncbi:hypothetical protein HK096_004289 [Nowakowskiella sp. JEL0078]|nr:hypothetical protein HK096_004289 [Nowakowskiella sp. JEL0078]
MGENTLAILEYLGTTADLTTFEKRNGVLYYDILGISALWETATIHHIILSTITLITIFAGPIKNGDLTHVLDTFRASAVAFGSFLASILGAVLTGLWLALVVRTPQTWFAREWYPFLLFTSPMMTSVLVVVYLSRFGFSIKEKNYMVGSRERLHFKGLLLNHVIILLLTTYFRLGITSIFIPSIVFLTSAYIVDGTLGIFNNSSAKGLSVSKSSEKLPGYFSTHGEKKTRKYILYNEMSPIAYFVSAIVVFPTSGIVWAFLEAFVPLSGRMGPDLVTDAVVGVVFSLFGFFNSQLLLPLGQRLSPKKLRLALQSSALLTAFVILIFSASMFPYDELHPKRVLIKYTENATSGERSIFVSQIDAAAFTEVIALTENVLGSKPVKSTDPSDLSILYPLNFGMGSYKFNVSHIFVPEVERVENLSPAPQLTILTSIYNLQTGQRTVEFIVSQPLHVGVVMYLKGQLVEYSVLGLPQHSHSHLDGKNRLYGFRLVSGSGIYEWQITMVIQGNDTIKVDISGLEKDHFDELESVEIHPQAKHRKRHLWTSRFGPAKILNSVGDVLPKWTTPIFLSVDTATFQI